jgi:uncharacterized protein
LKNIREFSSSMIKTNGTFFILFILSLTIILSLQVPSLIPSNKSIFAQNMTNTIKTRDLVIDLGNGIKTNAQLTMPISEKGPYPGVLLVNFGGPVDMNETNGVISNGEFKTIKQFWQISQYLSEKGFAVLRFDKRGVGANSTVVDNNIWGNTTFNDLKHDAEKALAVLMQQPDVDVHRISIIGHSKGSLIAPRIAIDNPDKIKNIILMGAPALNENESTYQNIIDIVQYAKDIVDKNKDGFISLQEAFVSSMKDMRIGYDDTNHFVFLRELKPINNNNNSYVSIDNGLKPFLMNIIKLPTTAELSGACDDPHDCPIMKKSSLSLPPLLSIIDKVPSNTSILMLEGENDSPEQVLMLNQRLNEVSYPDHSFIVYQGLGHMFYPSSKLFSQIGPIQSYVLHDIFLWLSNHTK